MSYRPYVREITCRNRPQTRLKRGWENTVNKTYLKESVWETGLDFSRSAYNPVTGSCKLCKEPSGSIQGGEILGLVSEQQLFNKKSASRNYPNQYPPITQAGSPYIKTDQLNEIWMRLWVLHNKFRIYQSIRRNIQEGLDIQKQRYKKFTTHNFALTGQCL